MTLEHLVQPPHNSMNYAHSVPCQLDWVDNSHWSEQHMARTWDNMSQRKAPSVVVLNVALGAQTNLCASVIDHEFILMQIRKKRTQR